MKHQTPWYAERQFPARRLDIEAPTQMASIYGRPFVLAQRYRKDRGGPIETFPVTPSEMRRNIDIERGYIADPRDIQSVFPQQSPGPPQSLGKGAGEEAWFETDAWQTVSAAGGLFGLVGGAWHGYKRTNNTGWAIAWGLLGGIFWPIAIPIMFAQGFGEKK